MIQFLLSRKGAMGGFSALAKAATVKAYSTCQAKTSGSVGIVGKPADFDVERSAELIAVGV